jgi:hypothetical protein
MGCPRDDGPGRNRTRDARHCGERLAADLPGDQCDSRHALPSDSEQALTTAIAEAMPGDQLTIVGVCTGTYTVNKDLTLTEISKKQFPTPILDGGQAGTTLTVDLNVGVTLANLTGGFAMGEVSGGGIINRGTLTLDSSTVNGNAAISGGGIANSGTLTLNSSTVSQNRAEVACCGGGGIVNGGTLTLNSSTVSGNIGDFAGGIQNHGTLILNSSTVAGNGVGSEGGGIHNLGTVTLHSSTVSGNHATFGGGIENFGNVALEDSSVVSGNDGLRGWGNRKPYRRHHHPGGLHREREHWPPRCGNLQ